MFCKFVLYLSFGFFSTVFLYVFFNRLKIQNHEIRCFNMRCFCANKRITWRDFKTVPAEVLHRSRASFFYLINRAQRLFTTGCSFYSQNEGFVEFRVMTDYTLKTTYSRETLADQHGWKSRFYYRICGNKSMNLSNLSQQLNRNCIFSSTCWNQIPLSIFVIRLSCVPFRSKHHASFSALIYFKFLTKDMFLYIAKYFFFYISNLFIRCDIYNNKMWLGTWHCAFFLFYMHTVLMTTHDHIRKQTLFLYFHHTDRMLELQHILWKVTIWP